MDGLDVDDWPADQTLSVSGRAGRLALSLTLRNRSDRPLALAEASLAEVMSGDGVRPLRAQPAPIGLVVPANSALQARVRLRLDPATPAGRYRGHVRFGPVSRPVEIEVLEEVRLAIRPSPAVVDLSKKAPHRLAVGFENRGNVALTLDLAGTYPIGRELTIAGERPERDGVQRLVDLVGEVLAGGPRPVLVEAGSARLSMPEGPARLDPGQSLTLPLEMAPPDGLSATERYHLFAPVYAVDLHIVLVTAAKPSGQRPRARRTRGAER
jgi:hypothetical protein